MSNKLRNKSARVSFFAFQDMITAVTGVLMVVMMMLTLDLTEQATSPQAAARASLQQQVEQARRELATRTETLAQLQLRLNTTMNHIFVIPEEDRSGKEVVLLVLSATDGWVARMGDNNPTQVSLGNNVRSTIRQILDGFNPAHDRLVFYVRPSGISRFEDFRNMATNSGFSIGYDTADENRQYLLAPP